MDGIPPLSLLGRLRELPDTWLRDGAEGPAATVREAEEGFSGTDGARMIAQVYN